MKCVNYAHWMNSLSQSVPPTPVSKWQVKPGTVRSGKTIRSHIEYFAYSYNHKLPMLEFPQLHSSVCRPGEASPAQMSTSRNTQRNEFEKCPKWQMWKILLQDAETAFAVVPHLLIALLLNFWTGDAWQYLKLRHLGAIHLPNYGAVMATVWGRGWGWITQEQIVDYSAIQNFQRFTKKKRLTAGF